MRFYDFEYDFSYFQHNTESDKDFFDVDTLKDFNDYEGCIFLEVDERGKTFKFMNVEQSMKFFDEVEKSEYTIENVLGDTILIGYFGDCSYLDEV